MDTVVAVNHSDVPVQVEVGAAEVLLGTDRARQGEKLEGDLGLDPWEAVVIAADGSPASGRRSPRMPAPRG